MYFYTGGSIIMDYGLIFCPEVTVQNALIMYVFVCYKHAVFCFTRLVDWSNVDYLRIIVMFLCAVGLSF